MLTNSSCNTTMYAHLTSLGREYFGFGSVGYSTVVMKAIVFAFKSEEVLIQTIGVIKLISAHYYYCQVDQVKRSLEVHHPK